MDPANLLTKWHWIVELARKKPGTVLYSLNHVIDFEWMREAYIRTRKDGATGIDGVTAQDYEANLEATLGTSWSASNPEATKRHRCAEPTFPRLMVRSGRSAFPRPRRTALLSNQPLGSAEVVHPFHPLRGKRFVVLKIRRVAGIERLSLRDPILGSFAMPREWTDWASPDERACASGSSLVVDAFGLVALAELIASLRVATFGIDR